MPKKRETLTIFLLKEESEQGPRFRTPGNAGSYVVKFRDRTEARLYAAPGRPVSPKWHSFVSPAVTELPAFWASNAPALLIVPQAGRSFAVCFGHSRGWLEPGSWEEDFGLKVTLNSVDAGRLRSVDRMSFDAIGQHSKIQASREADISEFGLDLEQDMLRAVSGKPRDLTLGDQLEGRDSLRVSLRLDIDDLPDLLRRYHQQSLGTQYKERFPWVDQISEVKDPAVVSSVNEILVERISRGDLNNIWPSIPEIIDWTSIEGFVYSAKRTAEVHPDVYLPDYLREIQPRRLDLNFLKQRRVQAVNAEKEVINQWTVLRCLYAEIESDDKTFVLTNGKWYSIGEPFLQRVNGEFSAIVPSTIALPDYEDAAEGAYSARVCAGSPEVFALMDLRTIVCDGARDRVEVCDIYSRDKQFIHIKRYSGSSAPLSHLFAQAVVSATTFKKNGDFRFQFDQLLPELLRPVTDPPRIEEYEVVLAIISKSRNPLRLPFFSKVNLNSTAERIGDLGYRLTLQKVETAEVAA